MKGINKIVNTLAKEYCYETNTKEYLVELSTKMSSNIVVLPGNDKIRINRDWACYNKNNMDVLKKAVRYAIDNINGEYKSFSISEIKDTTIQ